MVKILHGPVHSRLQKVGIWTQDALCWLRLWGWRTVVFQLFELHNILYYQNFRSVWYLRSCRIHIISSSISLRPSRVYGISWVNKDSRLHPNPNRCTGSGSELCSQRCGVGSSLFQDDRCEYEVADRQPRPFSEHRDPLAFSYQGGCLASSRLDFS